MIVLAMSATASGEFPHLWETPPEWPPTLRDIASRLPRDTDAWDSDLITYGHEGSHFLCRGKPGGHLVYSGSGGWWEIPTPPLTTEEVMASVPEHRRGSVYLTYLRQGKTDYWHRQPLMLCDEWRAYTVGTKIRAEMRQRGREETVRHCITFAYYVETLVRLAEECEGYDTRPLRAFCAANLEDCRSAVPRWDDLCDARFRE